MINIALVTYKYPPEYSGYGNQAYAVAEEIARQTQDIFFTVLTYSNNKYESTENSEVVGFNTIWLKENNHVKFFYFGFLAFRWLLINRKRYDLIHCLASGPHTVWIILAGKILRKKVILKITQNEMKDIKTGNLLMKLLRFMRQSISGKADSFVAISQNIYADLKYRGIDDSRIVMIPNGVSKKRFEREARVSDKKEVRSKLGLNLNDRVIIFTGALNERKGVKDLVAVVKENDFGIPVTLLVCGPDYGLGSELFNGDDLPFNQCLTIRYDGVVDNIGEYLAASDIFVLPSYDEGLSNSLLEAAICRLAVIATNISGNQDVINHGTSGYLYPPGELEQLKVYLNELVRDVELCEKFGSNIYEKVAADNSIEEVAKKYIDLYRSNVT